MTARKYSHILINHVLSPIGQKVYAFDVINKLPISKVFKGSSPVGLFDILPCTTYFPCLQFDKKVLFINLFIETFVTCLTQFLKCQVPCYSKYYSLLTHKNIYVLIPWNNILNINKNPLRFSHFHEQDRKKESWREEVVKQHLFIQWEFISFDYWGGRNETLQSNNLCSSPCSMNCFFLEILLVLYRRSSKWQLQKKWLSSFYLKQSNVNDNLSKSVTDFIVLLANECFETLCVCIHVE